MNEEKIIKELKHKLKVNEKSRRKMQQSLMKEIERLNNIIADLEKWLLEEHKRRQKWYNETLTTNEKRYYEEKYIASLIMINVFFSVLQALKRR